MFQTWDFVDPKLAKKLKSIQQQICQLRSKKSQIIANNRISNQAKKKLLLFNEQHMKDLLSMMAKQKQSMTDYFDTQITVLTKEQAQPVKKNPKNNQTQKSCQSYRSIQKQNQSEQLTKLTFDEDQSNTSCNLNKTKNFISFSVSDRDRGENSGNFELNSTGRLTTKINYKHKQKLNQTSNYQLSSTITNRHQSYKNQPKNIKQNLTPQQLKNFRKNHTKKASKINVLKNKMKRNLAKKQFQLQMEKIIHRDIIQEARQLRKQTKQNKQLIQLLYKKIQLLQLNKNKYIQEKVKKIQESYKTELTQLKKKYLELTQVQQQNKGLLVKRKQMLKIYK